MVIRKKHFEALGTSFWSLLPKPHVPSKSDSNLFKSRGERSRFQNSFWSCLATNTVSNSIGVACASHRTTTSCLMWWWWTSEWRTTKTCCNPSAPSIHLNNIRSCWYKSKSQSHPVTRATIRNTCDFEIQSAYLLGRREVCDSFQTVLNRCKSWRGQGSREDTHTSIGIPALSILVGSHAGTYTRPKIAAAQKRIGWRVTFFRIRCFLYQKTRQKEPVRPRTKRYLISLNACLTAAAIFYLWTQPIIEPKRFHVLSKIREPIWLLAQ